MCEENMQELETQIREEYEKLLQEALSPEAQEAVIRQGHENFLKDCDSYVKYGFDIVNRKLMISDPINEVTVGIWARALQMMNVMSPTDPIDVFVSSYGGSVYDGLALVDVIESLDAVVRTYALGKVCSMGFIIFLMGDERFAYPRTSFMHHQSYTGTEGNLGHIKNDVEETERIDEICSDIVVERTKKSRKWWNSQIEKTDFWFDASTAKKLGVVREILIRKANGER